MFKRDIEKTLHTNTDVGQIDNECNYCIILIQLLCSNHKKKNYLTLVIIGTKQNDKFVWLCFQPTYIYIYKELQLTLRADRVQYLNIEWG